MRQIIKETTVPCTKYSVKQDGGAAKPENKAKLVSCCINSN